MSIFPKAVVVLGNDPGKSAQVKSLVEFMDMPCVITAMPDDWKLRLESSRLEAVFISPDLSNDAVNDVLVELGEFDPNVPVVFLNESNQ